MPLAEPFGAALGALLKDLADTNRRYRRTSTSKSRARRRVRWSRVALTRRVSQLEDDLVLLERLHFALGRALEETGSFEPRRSWELLRELDESDGDRYGRAPAPSVESDG